mmetsp:Transcript_7673/g.19056  ORF Transcript_7673/g.19056 Transcript_7673/m.19056 type:complete len:245 (-) Transcript_7673:379-1113(-)
MAQGALQHDVPVEGLILGRGSDDPVQLGRARDDDRLSVGVGSGGVARGGDGRLGAVAGRRGHADVEGLLRGRGLGEGGHALGGTLAHDPRGGGGRGRDQRRDDIIRRRHVGGCQPCSGQACAPAAHALGERGDGRHRCSDVGAVVGCVDRGRRHGRQVATQGAVEHEDGGQRRRRRGGLPRLGGVEDEIYIRGVSQKWIDAAAVAVAVGSTVALGSVIIQPCREVLWWAELESFVHHRVAVCGV